MEPWLDEPDVRLYHGEVLKCLRALPDECIQTVVTSPPYFGLRDYGTGQWGGGVEGCDHMMPVQTYNHGFNQRWGNAEGQKKQETKSQLQYASVCGKCGAQRIDEQIGRGTFEEYVGSLVSVFREVRRIVTDTGTLWLNLGDTYAASASSVPDGLKPKDLIGVPWRVAFALQADGWYLRSDIIWNRPNAMPESVRDRPGRAHEYVFLFSKKAKYYYDNDAVKVPAAWERWGKQTTKKYKDSDSSRAVMVREATKEEIDQRPKTRNLRTVWDIPTKPYAKAHFATFPPTLVETCIKAGSAEGDIVLDPFVGSGTTAMVATQLGRQCIGIDLNEEYLRLAVERISNGK